MIYNDIKHLGKTGFKAAILLLALLYQMPVVSEGVQNPVLKTLDSVIQRCRGEGIEIVYSSKLVDSGELVPTTAAEHRCSVMTMNRILEPLDLKIVAVRRNLWLIVYKEKLTGLVSGVVTDHRGRPIPAAQVRIADEIFFVNELGQFSLTPEKGTHLISATAPGFVFERRKIKVSDEPWQLEFQLLPEERLDNIVVTASRYELLGKASPSKYLVTSSQIEADPSLGDDAIRVIQRLPGAATIGVSSRPRIRGGAGDEVLVMFDGVELVDPFHLKDYQSIFSTFNPQTIGHIEYFTGGFPARYGNRMSGVLDISTQESTSSPGGELGLSIFSASVLAYGYAAGGDWLASVRRGNLDVILDRVNPALGDPSYHDAYFRYGWESDSAGRFEFNGLQFSDDIKFVQDLMTANSEVKNNYLWFKWDKQWSGNLFSQLVVSYGSIENERRGTTDDPDKSTGFLMDEREFKLFTLNQNFDWKLSGKLKLEAGFTFKDESADYSYVAASEHGAMAGLLGLPEEINYDINEKFSGPSGGIFLSARYAVNDTLTIQPGFRWDFQKYQDQGTESQVSPRISVLFEPTRNTDYRFSAGRFYQPQAIYELQVSDGESRFFGAQYADHAIASVTHLLTPDLSIKAEYFYKRMKDLKPRYENLFNDLVIVPELEADRFRINASEGKSRGIELGLVKSLRDSLSWYLNYAYSKVQDNDSGRWISRRWDQRQTVNAGISWEPGLWKVSVAAGWHSGWAFTALPNELETESSIEISDIRSNERARDYGTLDIKISRNFLLPGSTISIFIEVTNAFNRNNNGAIDYEISEEDGLFILEEKDVDPVLPLVTSVGILWRF